MNRAIHSAAILALWAGACGVTAPAWGFQKDGPAQATTPRQPPESSPTDVELLTAIALYRDGDRAGAFERFTAILERDPQNAGALYWCGLIEMERGLQARKAARGTTDSARMQQLDQDARLAFQRARERLSALLSLAATDPEVRRLRPVEAGLTLGIAQLAGTDAERLALARDAVTTLNEYNRQMDEAGTPDYLGHFFLAIAKWRLGIYGEDQAAVAAASESFETALRLAPEPDPSAPPPADVPTERETVRLYKNYYEGIVKVLGRERDEGMRLLDQVAADAARYPALEALRADAQTLRRKAEQVGSGYEPIQFNTPVGFLEFRGDLQIGGGYDSNVILLGDGTALPRGIPHKYDYFGEVYAGAEVSRRFTKDQGFDFGQSLTLGIGGDTSDRWHPSVREYDVNQYRGRVFLLWEPVEELFNYWEYQYADTELGHEPFIGAHSAYISLTKRFSRPEEQSYGTALTGYYLYENRTYYDAVFDQRLDRDGNYHLVGLRQSFDLVRADRLWQRYYEGKTGVANDNDRVRWLLWYIGYEYRDERTQGNEFDMYSNGVLTGVEVPLPWRLTFDYGARISWDEYNSYSLFDFGRDARDELRQVHTWGLTYTIVDRGERKPDTLQMRLRGSIDLTVQDSDVIDARDQAVYSYNRAQYWLGLIVSF